MNDMAEKIGLFLGKFTILHSGHQYVIDTALNEMDKLIILIYDAPSSTAIPLDIRAGWIEKIYAKFPIEVVVGWSSPEDTGYSDEVKRIQNEYILKMVGDRGITHFYSSEPYGEHVSEAMHCVNRIVDIDRTTFPLAASTIQKTPYLYRKYIHPTVYGDLITNITFVGAPSTGKTTIAAKMSSEFNTVWMPEYGRTYWEKHHVDRRLESWQLTDIAEGHLAQDKKNCFRQTNIYSLIQMQLQPICSPWIIMDLLRRGYVSWRRQLKNDTIWYSYVQMIFRMMIHGTEAETPIDTFFSKRLYLTLTKETFHL